LFKARDQAEAQLAGSALVVTAAQPSLSEEGLAEVPVHVVPVQVETPASVFTFSSSEYVSDSLLSLSTATTEK